VHLWSGVAATKLQRGADSRKTLRALVTQIPGLAIGLIEGLTLGQVLFRARADARNAARSPSALPTSSCISSTPMCQGRGRILIGAAFTMPTSPTMVGATRQWTGAR